MNPSDATVERVEYVEVVVGVKGNVLGLVDVSDCRWPAVAGICRVCHNPRCYTEEQCLDQAGKYAGCRHQRYTVYRQDPKCIPQNSESGGFRVDTEG